MGELVGVVEFFDRHSGFGQIVGADHRVYRTHRKDLAAARALQSGDRVVFIPAETPRGPRAMAVRPLEGSC
jgi:cold shock CspA family protein